VGSHATIHRTRPILLTAAAASLGMVPIAPTVFWGPMAEFPHLAAYVAQATREVHLDGMRGARAYPMQLVAGMLARVRRQCPLPRSALKLFKEIEAYGWVAETQSALLR
jgi:hypothetical protein